MTAFLPGQMMQMPLGIPAILDFAARYHGEAEIVSRTVEGPIHRYSYAALDRRVRRLANALARLGVKPGDAVGTLAWNTHRHVEIYYATALAGAVCHTINPRLFVEQIVFIVTHARDGLIFTDLTFLPLLEGLADRLEGVRGFVVMTDRAHMPKTSLHNAWCYEELLAAEAESFAAPAIDENSAASLCYTSGTTGEPKGVLYSHRSTVLHALSLSLPDALCLSARDALLPIVPMFHVNAWGLSYSSALTGCKLVLPGPHLDGASLAALMDEEGVTVSAGVPTVWFNLLAHMEQGGRKFRTLNRVATGGTACPEPMFDAFERLGVRVLHAWGMTEMSPLGTVNAPTRATEMLPAAERRALSLKQGRPMFGVDLKIVDDEDEPLPFDGTSAGRLKVRGPWICEAYYRLGESEAHAEPGWFDTGDIATIDRYGFVQIVDRAKDLIKSGGEWVSSIDLEAVAIAHPAVREAAAIGRPHVKWGERPIVVVVLKPGAQATPEELRGYYSGRVGKWFEPDEVIIVDRMPYGPTGKILKTDLRKRFAV